MEEFGRSGLSGAAFARRRRLCYSTFCRWRSLRPSTGLAQGTPPLQAVPLSSLLGGGWAAEIAWPDGRLLRLQERVAPNWVAALVEALRR